jgi:predicted nuclease of predicted toxin-antitoxin system
LRFLLDQNLPQEIALVFQALRHEADHTDQVGLARALDPEIALAARHYDVLVTLDIHRQEFDWIAVHRAIVEQGVNVLRLRLPKGVRRESLNLTIIRQLTYKFEEWTEAFSKVAALVTISREENDFRARTRAEVQAVIQQRSP